MTTVETILLSLVTSAGAAAVINAIFWNRQKKVEFKWTYKQYILNKRTAAYDSVQKVIHLCLLKRTDNSNFQIHAIFDNKEKLADFIQLIETIQTGWISEDIMEILEVLKGMALVGLDNLSEIENYHGYEEGKEKFLSESEVLEVAGSTTVEKIDELNEELQNAYMRDIKNLGDIDSFIKRYAKIPNNVRDAKYKKESI